MPVRARIAILLSIALATCITGVRDMWTDPDDIKVVTDLVLLDADPLVDISNTRKTAVIVGGRLFRRADLDELLTAAEAAAKGQ